VLLRLELQNQSLVIVRYYEAAIDPVVDHFVDNARQRVRLADLMASKGGVLEFQEHLSQSHEQPLALLHQHAAMLIRSQTHSIRTGATVTASLWFGQ